MKIFRICYLICVMVIIRIKLVPCHDTDTENVGFCVSVGYQSPQLTASKIGDITSSMDNITNYRFYGWSDDHKIALAILSKAINPKDIKFFITFPPSKVNTLSNDDIELMLNKWDSLRDNVYYIGLGYEPTHNSIDLSVLPSKMRMIYQFLEGKTGWQNVETCIPFSGNIFGVTYPTKHSTFKSEYKQSLLQILYISYEYDAPFCINLYPFYVLTHPELLYLEDYCLGESSNELYNSMIEAQYHSTWYAIQDISNYSDIEIIISETGWSSASNVYSFATLQNANDFLTNTIKGMNDPTSVLYKVKVFFFELFDENERLNGDWMQHFGFYNQGYIKYKELPILFNDTDKNEMVGWNNTNKSYNIMATYLNQSSTVVLQENISSKKEDGPTLILILIMVCVVILVVVLVSSYLLYCKCNRGYESVGSGTGTGTATESERQTELGTIQTLFSHATTNVIGHQMKEELRDIDEEKADHPLQRFGTV